MFKSKRRQFDVLILFLLTISLCFLFNLIPVKKVKAQSPSTNAQTITNSSNRYVNLGQHDLAIDIWLKALKSAPTAKIKASIHNNLASAYQLAGNLSEAIEPI